jgi:hypothetical protein
MTSNPTPERKCCENCWSDGRFTDVGCVKASCNCHSPAPQGRVICPGCKVCLARGAKTGKECARLYECTCHYLEASTEDVGQGKDTLEAPQTEKWEGSFIAEYRKVHSFEDSMYGRENRMMCNKFLGLIQEIFASQRKEDAERIAGLPAVAGELDPYVKVAMTGNMAQMFDYGYNKAKDDALRILGDKKEI